MNTKLWKTGQYMLATDNIPHPKPTPATGPHYLVAGDPCQIMVYDPSKTNPYGVRKQGDNFAVVYVAEQQISPNPAYKVPDL